MRCTGIPPARVPFAIYRMGVQYMLCRRSIVSVLTRNQRTTTSPAPANQYMPYSRPQIPGPQAPSQPPPDNQHPHQRPTYDAFHPPSQHQQTPQPSAPYDNQPSHQQQQQQHQQRPQSYAPPSTNNPQELATSVYDSPIAPHNPHSAATYSSSTYSPDEPSAPTYAPPNVPGDSAPPPLNPSGPAYDARQGLPSQGGGAGAGGGGGGQYKAYVPPSSAY